MTNLPILLWDGDCGFCAKWILRWKRITKDKIHYVPCQDFPQISPEDCGRSVWLLMPDGTRYQAAEAVFRALDYAGVHQSWFWLYQHLPGFKFFSERAYQFVAKHRRWA